MSISTEHGERVAPFTGAWIETARCAQNQPPPSVAPFTGAWIETGNVAINRGAVVVAPFTGAWIETSHNPYFLRQTKSHPSRVRGLKLKAH